MQPLVSLSAIDTRDYWPTVYALQRTLKTLDHVNITKIYWCSDIPFPIKLDIPTQWIRIPKITAQTWNYICSKCCLKLLPEHVTEDFNIIVHDDGYAVNKSAWTNEFFNIDYIGAIVPPNCGWHNSHVNQVGNGGFSMRSKKLYQAIAELDPTIEREEYHKDPLLADTALFREWLPEDLLLSVLYYEKLTKDYGIQFASIELADQWSIELNFNSPWLGKSLGFHGKYGTHHHYGEILLSDRKKFSLI